MQRKFMYYETTARIQSITKSDMSFCSSRVISAKLVDEETGEVFDVSWASSPTIDGITGLWQSRAKDSFERAWTTCEEGDVVRLFHGKDQNSSYFDII